MPRVFVVGATGTIGRATVAALLRSGYDVTCFVRPGRSPVSSDEKPAGVVFRSGDVTSLQSVREDGMRAETFDAVISCLASRTGAPDDAWAIDYRAQLNVLAAAQDVGVPQFILLSAICVQKPLLAFQHAKLAFENALMESGVDYSIVRATAFFKSLSGQVARVQQGKPYLLFGDGALTACKPISDRDLAEFLADCIGKAERKNRILPIGGPGPAITPREQGEYLFKQLGKPARYRRMPVAMLDGIIRILDVAGRIAPSLAGKAELARIGRYYATESMLVLNPATGRYDADATPSTGVDTLFDYYDRLLKGEEAAERGDHAVF